MKILLVEDSNTLSRLFQVQLRQLGHTVATALDKATALVTFTSDEFDMIFIDMGLEGQQDRGVQILREIKMQKPEQRVVILSSNDTRDLVHQSKEGGAEFYMVKPFTTDGVSLVLNGDKQAVHDHLPGVGEGRIIVL